MISLGLAGVLWAGCSPRPDSAKEVLLRHHFAGLTAVGARADLGQVKTVLALPESQHLLDEASRKLAIALPTWFGAPPAGTNDATALQPVVRALFDAESCLEVRQTAGGETSWALAARVEAAPLAARVGTELRRVLGAPPATGKPDAAFDAAVAGKAGAVRFAAEGGWLILGSGRSVVDDFAAAARAGQAPVPGATNGVLSLEADLSRLAQALQWRDKPPGPVDQWPRLSLTLEPRNGRLRTAATLDFARALQIPHEPWMLPTNVLRDPLVGFSAVQGADTWIRRLGVFSDLGVETWPRQIFLWSIAGDASHQYFSTPTAAPTNLLATLARNLPVKALTNVSWKGMPFGVRLTNHASRAELLGVPFFGPFLEAQSLGGGEQLYGGLFPTTTNVSGPPPAALLAQVQGRTNLVIYDWETTGRRVLTTNRVATGPARVQTNDVGRLVQFAHLAQFGTLMGSSDIRLLPTTASGEVAIPGIAWVQQAIPHLGDTITEVTQTGPARLNLVRQSVTGMNSLELIYLLRWVGNAGFPGWSDAPPPVPPERLKRLQGPPVPPPLPGAAAPKPNAASAGTPARMVPQPPPGTPVSAPRSPAKP